MKRKPPPAKDTFFSGLVFFAVAALAAMGVALCFVSSLQLPHAIAVYWGASIGLGVMLGLFCLPPKGRRWGLVVALAAWAAGLGAFWAQVWMGAEYVLEWILYRFYLIFPGLGTVPEPYSLQAEAASGTFLLLVPILLGGYVCWAVLWRKSLLLCLAATLPLFGFVVNMYALTHVAGTVMLLAAWAALLCKGQLGRFRPTATAGRSLVAMGLAVLYLCLLVGVWPAQAYHVDQSLYNTRWQITNWASDLYTSSPFGSGRGGLRGAPLAGRQGRVNLAQTGHLEYGDETALRVRGYSTGGLYLRAYSAAVYTGQSWQQLPNSAYKNGAFGFEPLTYMPRQYLMSEEERQSASRERSEMEIETVNANPAYIYTPYFLAEVGTEGESFAFQQDASIRPTGGSRSYTASSYGYIDSASGMMQGLARIDLIGASYEEVNETLSDIGYVILAEEEGGWDGSRTVTISVDSSILFEQAPPAEEEAYLQFLSSQYLQLPEGLGDSLRLLAAQAGIQRLAKGPEDWYVKALQVAEFVRSAATYTRSPGSQPRNQDFVLYFLTQSRRGYCVHFATAAVAMLRALGVPARYVEGYVCGEKVGTQNWTDIPSTSAHAWVEVWLPNYGWMPLEVTPGGADGGRQQTEQQENERPDIQLSLPTESQEAETSSATNSSVPEPETSSSPQPISQAGAETSGRQSENEGMSFTWPSWVRSTLRTLIVVVLGLGLLWAARHYTGARRRQSFAQKDTNRAALAIYRYLTRLRLFGYVPTEEARQLAGKARFSQHTLTQAECGALRAEAKAAREELRSMLPWYKRILFWLLGL